MKAIGFLNRIAVFVFLLRCCMSQECKKQFLEGKSVVCDEDGLFEPVVCDDINCYCVSKETGERLPGRVYPFDETLRISPPNCNDQRSSCELERDIAIRLSEIGARQQIRKPMVCDVNGRYLQAQCDIDNFCNCVDRETGRMVGKRYHILAFDFLCDDENDGSDRIGNCIWRRQQINYQSPIGIEPLECTSEGTYSKKQCSGDHCWCIDGDFGLIIRGTRMKRDKPMASDVDCDSLPEQRCTVPELVNGYIVLPKGGIARRGARIKYVCDDGYKLNRPFYNRCYKDLQFSKPDPVCTKI